MSFNEILRILFICLSLSGFAKQMTLEEKVGQLLVVHFNGENVNEDAKTLIQKIHVGGIIYYNWANGLHSPEQVSQLSAGLQELSSHNRIPIPLLIAVDQEGGLVARLTKGFTIFPGNRALGMTGDPALAEQCAFAMGQELRAVGVNFNLSPVVDVNSNPRNPVIGIRSFGDTAEIVVPFARRALQGYHRANIITSLKHFPGHGDVEVDSHQDLPVINKSKQQLDAVELLPFAKLAKAADTVMTAHLMVPSLDPVNCATLSKKILDILRKEMGFEGVIIADSLVMEGLLKNCTSIEDAVIRALNAGCDLLMLGGKQLVGAHESLELKVADIERIHQTLVQVVKKGLVSEQRVDEAVQRVLKLKKRYHLGQKDASGLFQASEHVLIAEKVASLALKAGI
jgi:beta-N-acetylhexosaminidase